jgi:nucleoside-diphosphate-sugar epimerase
MGQRNEIYNLVATEETTTGDLARLVQTKFGFEVGFNEKQTEGASLPYMSSRKAMQRLGWVPTPLAEGIDQMVHGAQGAKGALVGRT